MSLRARDLLASGVLRVRAESLPIVHQDQARANPFLVFAVFENDSFLGVVDSQAALRFPDRVFGDLCHAVPSTPIPESTPLEEILKEMERQERNVLPVTGDEGRFLGAVSRSGISDFLLRQTRERLLGIERIVETGMDLGAAPALEVVLRKTVELAARLTGARYGALLVLGEAGGIDRFVTTGIDEATRESVGRPPESMALLGELLREGKTLRLKDLARHPKFSGFPPHHPVMRSLLGVPIRYRDRVIGDLYLADRQGADEFSEEDETLALAFSTQAALAIENARLYAETRERLRHTETLLAVSQAVGSTLDLTEVLRRTVREIVRALGADVGGAYLLTPSRDRVTALAGYRVPKDLFEGLSSPPLLLDHPLIKELRESKRPICSGDSRADPRFDYPLLRLLPHKSVLMSPMWLKDEIIGGFAIGWFREAHTFTPEEPRLVEGITRQAAVAIENARLLEAERQARTQLAISETRYRELFEDVIDIVYVHDLDGKILAINKAGVRASGYTEEELLRMNIAQLMAPEELARNKELMRRMVAGERISEFFTAEFIRKDGTRGFRECSGRLVVKDGVPVALQGVARDVTVRRKLEQRHAAFDEIVKELAAEEDLEQIFSLIGERICQLLGTDSAAFVQVEGEELVLRGSYGLDGPLPGGERRKISESRVGRVVLTRKPHASSDMSVDPHWRDSAVVTQFGYRAILEVPIILQGEVVGVLGALHRSPRAFSSEDMALLASLAGHTAIALDRTNLVRELKSRLRETQTLLTVSQAVGSTFDLTETMRRVARQTAKALGADMAGAYLADPDGSVLRPLAGYHVPKPLLDGFMKLPIRLRGHRFLEAAWESKRPVYSSDAPADPRIHRETFERFPHRSVLFFPMIVKGEPIGGLFVIWWEEKHHFTPEELRLVEGISRQAALAVENARLFASQQEEAEISGALLKLAEAVGGLQDLDSVLQTVVRVTPQLLGLTRCGLFLLDPAAGVLIPTAAWGLSETLRPAFLALKGAPQIPAVAKAVKSQEPVAVEEATVETWIPRTVATALDIRSMLIIPLLSGGRLMGTMAVDTPGAAHAFTAKQIAIARGIAAHAAVAIDNARLFDEAQRRRREAEVVAHIARTFNASLDLGTVLERVAEGAKDLCGSDMCRIALRDPRSEAMVFRHWVGSRYHGYDTMSVRAGRGVGGQVLATGRPFRIDRYREDPPLSEDDLEVAREEGVVAEMAVPIWIGDRVEGLLFVDNRSPRPFTDRDEAILLRLADYATLAIQNARLYEKTAGHGEEQAALLRLSQGFLAARELREVLDHAVSVAQEVFRVDLTAILLPEDGETLRLASGVGWKPGVVGTARAGLDSPAGYALRVKEPVVVWELGTESRFKAPPPLADHGVVSAMIVPMLAGETAIGVMGAHSRTHRRFSADEARLFSLIANQTAVAIERIRLLEETRRQHLEAVTLEAVAREITSSLEPAEVFQRIVDRTRELCGGDLAFLAPYNREAGTASIAAVSGARTEALRSVTVVPGRGAGGRVLETGEPFHSEDYLHDPRISKDYAEVAVQEGIVSEAVVPLRFRGTTTGLLWVVNRTARRFTARDLAVLAKLADQAAIALENSRLYEELRRALEAVEASQQRIVQSERLKALGELAGGVAHDFNNSLAIILGRAHLLLSQTEDPAFRRQLRVIEKAGTDAARTVQRIQEFTRRRSARPLESVNLNQVVEEVMEVTRARWKDEAQTRGLRYDVRVEATPLPLVAGDSSELREALTSLVFNALEAMPQGGELTFRTGLKGEQVYCAVADTGVGMPEEVRRRVFEPFFTTKVEKGSGLGLSVAYGIVTRHGGEIEAQSQVGRGSAFTIWLPAGREIAEPSAKARPPRPDRSANILVIEDEREVREVLVELLATQGHRVAACPDGASGLARFREERFDLVITDLGMPGVSGWEVARLVKELSPETPVTLLTGWSHRIDADEARAKGVDFLVAKPFELEDLTAVLARALSRPTA